MNVQQERLTVPYNSYAWTGSVSVNRNYTANGLNQYTAAGGTGFTYDANGNLTGDGTWVYTYDAENHLIRATGAGKDVTLRYDPLGRLYFVGGSNVGDVTFLYDGDALISEYNSAGTVTNRYVHGSNAAADDPLVRYLGSAVGSSNRRYFHADHEGSIVAQSDGSGTNVAINTYDEYGIPGSGNDGRFGYTGQATLYEIGLDYYKARMYSPTLGRFLQTDPIGYDGGANLYAYVGDDPVDKVDPSGDWQCEKGATQQCAVISTALSQLRGLLPTLHGSLARQVSSVLSAWGADNKANGVFVTSSKFGGVTTSTQGGKTTVAVSSGVKNIHELQVAVNSSAAGVVAHEGDHILYERNVLGGRDPSTKQESYNMERRGSRLEGQVSRAAHYGGLGRFGGTEMRWDESWRGRPDEGARMEDASRGYAWGVSETSGLRGDVTDPW